MNTHFTVLSHASRQAWATCRLIGLNVDSDADVHVLVLVPSHSLQTFSTAPFVLRILRWLAENVERDEVTVQEAAWEIGFSRTVLQRETQRHFGVPFKRFFRIWRSAFPVLQKIEAEQRVERNRPENE